MIRTIYWDDSGGIERIAELLRQGMLVVCSTDTIFGLLAPASAAGRDALDRAKGRADQPYLVLVSSKKEALDLIDASQNHGRLSVLFDACWPGQVTFICQAASDAPRDMKAADGSIAIRMPAHDGLQKLAASLGSLFSTSANPSGEPAPCSPQELDPQVTAQVAAVVIDRPADKACQSPSTIVDCRDNALRIVREGSFPSERLRHAAQAAGIPLKE